MKRILAVGNICKYTVAGEQKEVSKIIVPEMDKNSQEYARQYFNGMFKAFAEEVKKTSN